MKPQDKGFDYESILGWERKTERGYYGLCYYEFENGTNPKYFEEYEQDSRSFYKVEYYYLNLATNVYPFLLRLFPVKNGCSPIGGKLSTKGLEFQKLPPHEQNKLAPIIARGMTGYVLNIFCFANRDFSDYMLPYEDEEEMRDYYMIMQDRWIDLHDGRKWRGIDLTTMFEDEHLKTETEYYEQAKVSLPKYLGEHHPQLVKYALEFGKDYLEFAKKTIADRRKYTAEQAIIHRQGYKSTEDKQVASSMASSSVSTIVEAESDSKLEDAVSKLSFMGREKAKAFLITTRGMTPTKAARHCPILNHGEGRKVYDIWCMYNGKTPTKSNYQNTFARGMKVER